MLTPAFVTNKPFKKRNVLCMVCVNMCAYGVCVHVWCECCVCTCGCVCVLSRPKGNKEGGGEWLTIFLFTELNWHASILKFDRHAPHESLDWSFPRSLPEACVVHSLHEIFPLEWHYGELNSFEAPLIRRCVDTASHAPTLLHGHWSKNISVTWLRESPIRFQSTPSSVILQRLLKRGDK